MSFLSQKVPEKFNEIFSNEHLLINLNFIYEKIFKIKKDIIYYQNICKTCLTDCIHKKITKNDNICV